MNYHFGRGEYEGSLPYLKQILRLAGKQDDISFAHLAFGTAYLNIGKYNSAIKHLKKLLEFSGENVEVLFLLARAYEFSNQIEKALECLMKAQKLEPGNENILLGLSIYRFLTGDEEGAEKGFRETIKRNPDLVEAYVGLAQCKMAQDNFEEARALLMKAKESNPNAIIIYQCLKEMEKLENLKGVLSSIYNLNGEDPFFAPEEEVEEEIKTLMVENHFPPEVIACAERMWNDYRQKTPGIMRSAVESWAGAVVFAIAQLMGRKDIRQKDLAKTLGTSVSSVSKNYRTLVYVLALNKDGVNKYLPRLNHRE